MRKTSLLTVLLFFSIFSYSQTTKSKKSEKPILWTWNGKPIDEKTLRDSLRVFYLRHVDSVKNIKN